MSSPRTALAGLLALLACLCLLARKSAVVQAVELKTLDWRFQRFSPPFPKDPGIALLLLDQQSLDHYEDDGVPWPWPRSMYAAVLSFCKAGGARAVVFDALFTSPSPYGRAEDEAFAKALKGTGNVVLAAHFSKERGLPLKVLGEAAAGAGEVSARPDSDGVFRRVALEQENAGKRHPTLPAAAVLAVSRDKTLAAEPGGLRVGDFRVPLYDGRLLIRWHGARAFPTYPLGRVIQSWQNIEERQKPSLEPAALKDKLVFVGYSAPGLMDLRPTPVAPVSPGTEVVAAAAANVLTQDFLKPASAGVAAGLILLAVLAGAPAEIPLAAAASAALLLGAILAFRRGLWLEAAAPQLSLWLSFAASAAFNYAVEGRKKRQIQKAFAHYLAPEVVAEIADDPSRLKLGGERRELTCYFSDIENFTTISESLPPDRLTYLMNRYLGEMTDTILESKGTLDKYIGDAIMAFWGAPMAREDHALAACRVAAENQRKLVALSRALESEGFPPIRARIGLNSGAASVGNMGSAKRFSYTALGDDINLASRLEGANKVYGTYVMLAEPTRAQAGDAVETRELDLLKVKGKTKGVKVYELLGLKGQVDAARLKKARRFEAALALYRARRFEEALGAFAALDGDKAAKLYVERCKSFIKDVPAPDWDGSFALTEK